MGLSGTQWDPIVLNGTKTQLVFPPRGRLQDPLLMHVLSLRYVSMWKKNKKIEYNQNFLRRPTVARWTLTMTLATRPGFSNI